MVVAFCSMSVAPGSDEEIVRDFAKSSMVKEAWLTTGEFDILLIIEGPDTETINQYVNNEIRGMEGVIRAVVTFAIESIKIES